MPKKENILVEYPNKGVTTIAASDFYFDVCQGVPSPLLRLLEGQLYEQDGVKYCMNALDFKLDTVASAWLKG